MTNTKVMKFDKQKIEITRFGRQNIEIPKMACQMLKISSSLESWNIVALDYMLSIKT